MILNKLQTIEKTINSELSSKIKDSTIKYNELLNETYEKDLIDVVQFLKLNEKCKFRQLIDIAGVDLLFHNGGYKICEVNSNPGFEGMENFTKKNIAEEIVQFIKMKTGVKNE